ALLEALTKPRLPLRACAFRRFRQGLYVRSENCGPSLTRDVFFQPRTRDPVAWTGSRQGVSANRIRAVPEGSATKVASRLRKKVLSPVRASGRALPVARANLKLLSICLAAGCSRTSFLTRSAKCGAERHDGAPSAGPRARRKPG